MFKAHQIAYLIALIALLLATPSCRKNDHAGDVKSNQTAGKPIPAADIGQESDVSPQHTFVMGKNSLWRKFTRFLRRKIEAIGVRSVQT